MRFRIDVDGRTMVVERQSTADGVLFHVDEESFPVTILHTGDGSYLVLHENRCLDARIHESNDQFLIELEGKPYRARIIRGHATAATGLSAEESGRTDILAPMPGKIVRVMAAPGLAVEARQPLLVIEAMKMQNELRAPRKGTIVQVAVSQGQAVPAGALLLVLE